jgi:heme-degrading monooxygenase HmoA
VFHILWQFETSDDRSSAFVERYGPAGPWVALFARSPGYLGTDLLASTVTPRRFLTLDRWESRTAYEAFRRTRSAEYAALDAECEGLATSERFLTAWED